MYDIPRSPGEPRPDKEGRPDQSPARQPSPDEWSPGKTSPEIDPGEHAPERPDIPTEKMNSR